MKHPKDSPLARPGTPAPESQRLTPQEIDALREDARQMHVRIEAALAGLRAERAAAAVADKKQDEELLQAFERAAQHRRQ
jgi:acetylglutamate kinase